MILFARHGETPANSAHLAGSPESRVQGANVQMPLSERGEAQSYALGHALGEFVVAQSLEITDVYSSDAVRAIKTRDHVLSTAQLTQAPQVHEPDERLRELNKGDLEGMLRTEAYPYESIRKLYKTDWYYRHGTYQSGGESAYEAGVRWLDWFNEIAADISDRKDRATVVVGHSLVTAYGLWMLTHPEECDPERMPSLEVSDGYRSDNATAMIVERSDGEWGITGRLTPEPNA